MEDLTACFTIRIEGTKVEVMILHEEYMKKMVNRKDRLIRIFRNGNGDNKNSNPRSKRKVCANILCKLIYEIFEIF